MVNYHNSIFSGKYFHHCYQVREEVHGEIKLKETEQTKGDKVEQTPIVGSEVMGTNLKSKTSTSSAEQELDSFLLGDLEYRDSVPGTQCGKFVNAILMLAYHQNRM